MTTNSTRALASLGRLFRSVPAETLKSAIEDIEDFAAEGGEAAITRAEALTGPSEGMRGGGASPMIRRHSDLEPQMGRQAEYDSFSNILSDIAKAMKAQTDAITAALAPKAKVATAKSTEGELSYLVVVEKSLKRAKAEIFKAETEVEAENEDSSSDCIGKAERLVAKAAELLSKAEDDDEDEDRVEKARTDIRKLTKALKPFKDAAVAKAAAEVAKAEADALAKAEADKAAAVAKADADEKKDDDKKEDDKDEMSKSALETSVASLQDQFGVVTKSVADVLELVAGLSRNPKQPVFVAKAAETKVAEPVDFAARAQEMADSGLIKDTDLLKCQSLISRMAIIKGGQAGSLNIDQVKADVAASSSGVREVFASLFTA